MAHIEAAVTFLMIFEAHVNILFIVKLKVFVRFKCGRIGFPIMLEYWVLIGYYVLST